MKKLLIGTSLALALAATSASAATYHSRMQAQPNGYDAYAAANSGFIAGGPALYTNGQYLGWDPDPQIRQDLVRQGPAGNSNGE